MMRLLLIQGQHNKSWLQDTVMQRIQATIIIHGWVKSEEKN